MGAQQFEEYEAGEDVGEAFSKATDHARFMYGHGGYSGTLAEKFEYVMLSSVPRTMAEAEAFMRTPEAEVATDDKWGPAGAIRVVDPERKLNGWLFFGWASS